MEKVLEAIDLLEHSAAYLEWAEKTLTYLPAQDRAATEAVLSLETLANWLADIRDRIMAARDVLESARTIAKEA